MVGRVCPQCSHLDLSPSQFSSVYFAYTQKSLVNGRVSNNVRNGELHSQGTGFLESDVRGDSDWVPSAIFVLEILQPDIK